ncbi:MAG: hypothetical protein LBT48_06275 [Prevotellaceae bacterium]|nr:hypothetical protein [Prevotellaceae bacterium]
MNKTIIYSFLALISLSTCDGCGRQPKDQVKSSESTKTDPTEVLIKPTVNVYIENSGSMDGYVKGITEFENAVYNYLSDIMISGVSDSLNLFYINSKIIKYGSDIQDFIEKLEPSTFRARGGNRGTSDIANVIDAVLNETQENEIGILVTDGIFSPGKIDATEYLGIQQIGIKRRISDYLKRYPNTAVIVYQLSSNFSGTYYNKVDAKITINEQRPFYIYVIGDSKQISNLRNNVADGKFKGSGVKNVFTSVVGSQEVKYTLNPSIGKYKKSRKDTKTTIEDLEKDSRTKKVKFAVNVDFSGLLLDDDYLSDLNNYESHSKYEMEVKPSITKNGFTHTLTFTSDKVTKGIVSVKLKSKLPAWVEAANDDDGSTAAKGKTYGIKYQLGGIFDAFTFNNSYYTEIKININ